MCKTINSARGEVLAGDALLRDIAGQVKRFELTRMDAARILRDGGISEPEISEVCYDV